MALISDIDYSIAYTDKLNIYTGFFAPEQHRISKYKMQKIERLHLTYRTRIKRLSRKTICFSKSLQMHDAVVGLLVNNLLFKNATVSAT
jgi:insertion element IS1 protein InsB